MADVVGCAQKRDDQSTRRELEDIGVTEPMLSRLAQDPSVTPARIRRLHHGASNARNPAGAVITALRNGNTGLPDRLGTEELKDLVNQGLLDEIDGLPVGPETGHRARYNADSVQIFGPDEQKAKKILARDIPRLLHEGKIR